MLQILYQVYAANVKYCNFLAPYQHTYMKIQAAFLCVAPHECECYSDDYNAVTIFKQSADVSGV